MDHLLTMPELSAYLGIPSTTLRKWRVKRYGPHGVRLGRSIRYRVSDVEKWLGEQFDGTP